MNEKSCFAELLKMELMERYGLREDQVHLEISISTADLGLGKQILSDFDTKYPKESPNYFEGNSPYDYVYSTEVNVVGVNRKDGKYGKYVVKS